MIEHRTWYERSDGGLKLWRLDGVFLFGLILLKLEKRELSAIERAFVSIGS
jgi:hypothetical protein